MSSPLFPRQDYAIHCQTARAPDYYGLGVRLGIYFAWIQAYIANHFLPSEIASAADTNTIFLLALLTALIKCSSINMLEQIDGLVLMHLSGGTIFGILSLWGYRTRHYFDEGPMAIRHFGGFGTHSRLILSLGISVYGLWYWLFAVTGSLIPMGSPLEVGDLAVMPPNSPDCGTLYTFMFAKVRADGGIRIFYIIICILCTIYFGIMLLASSIAGWARVQTMLALGKQKRWADTSRLRFATGFNYHELQTIYKALRILNFAWLVYSVLLIEFTLNFNNVTAVLGGPNSNELHLPGQMLPLLIGAFGFVRICFLVFSDWRSPGDVEPSLSNDEKTRMRLEARTMHAKDLPLAFSPAMRREETMRRERDPGEVDGFERGRGWMARYLVSWLPWLSLLGYFRDEEVRGSEKRWSGYSGALQEREEFEFETPLERNERAPPLPDPVLDTANGFGLHLVYEPSSSPSLDIIFVHGLGGKSRRTWFKDRNPEFFWPGEWLPHDPDIGKARIFSYGYDAGFGSSSVHNAKSSIQDFAEDLLFQIRFGHDQNGQPFGIGKVPIVFVAFCLGGLVVKKAYILGLALRQYRDMSLHIATFIFLATPHRGTPIAEIFDGISGKNIPARTFIAEMRPNSAALEELNEKFCHDASNLLIFSFYETRKTEIGTGMSRLLVVGKDSAVLGYQGEISISIDADHHNVIKFANSNDTNYLKVLDSLKSVARQLLGEGHGLYAPLSFEKIEVRKHPDDSRI
ncbi:hypothetical protein N431DRAFT_476914 [Stipitochalara longipes BDJ]|nr:hypothetical protein N431DRAFT_476914 [Stipitochalara longipes BDJ]